MDTAISPTVGHHQIQAIIDKRIIGIYNRDEQAILSVYSPDVVTFDLAAPLQNQGIDGVKTRLQSWLASYTGHITQRVANIKIAVEGNLACSHNLTRSFGTSINGEEHDMWYRTTTCYKKTNGQWLIVHEHQSEPIDFETGKAMFDLRPTL